MKIMQIFGLELLARVWPWYHLFIFTLLTRVLPQTARIPYISHKLANNVSWLCVSVFELTRRSGSSSSSPPSSLYCCSHHFSTLNTWKWMLKLSVYFLQKVWLSPPELLGPSLLPTQHSAKPSEIHKFSTLCNFALTSRAAQNIQLAFCVKTP